MTRTQYLARDTIDTAGHLTAAGCRILAAHAHDHRPVVIATLPQRISPARRAEILAEAWRHPTMVEWR